MSSELSVSETTLLRRPESANSEEVEVSSSTALVPSSPNRSDTTTTKTNTTTNNPNLNNNRHKTTYSFTINNSIDKSSPVSSVAQQKNIEVNLNYNNHSINSNSNRSDIHNMEKNKRIFFRVGIDALILLCVGFPILFFHLWGVSYKRGFFCDDESLKHPFKDSTVRNWMLYFIGILLPVGTILIVEIIKSNNAARQTGVTASSEYDLFGYNIPDWLVEVYKKVGCFGFGAAISQLTTDIAKYSIGRLRPHFFAVCQPVGADNTPICNNADNIGKYITDFTCLGTGSTERMLKEVRLSFPSGHSSFTFYTMVFTALYLQSSMTWRGSKLLRHFLQFLFIMIAWFTALSRISDYKHHWSDVLAGGILGSLFALIVANFVSDMFKKNAQNSIVLPTTNNDLPIQTLALNGH